MYISKQHIGILHSYFFLGHQDVVCEDRLMKLKKILFFPLQNGFFSFLKKQI